MEWLPEVSIPYMQQVRCKITHADHITKVPRKRNRNNSNNGGFFSGLLIGQGVLDLDLVDILYSLFLAEEYNSYQKLLTE